MPSSASPRRARPILVATLLAAGCGGDGDITACEDCGEPTARGPLANAKLTETSGITASSKLPDVIYAHNDSGDSSRFFAVSRTGADLGIFKVTGAQNIDWEDMDRGPCPAGSCLYIADTGDNERERLAYTLYRMVEPTAVVPGEQSIAADRIVFTYPDGAHDAETLLVHPVTGDLTIVTKVESGPAQIFTLPQALTTGKTFMATEVGEVQPPKGDNKFTGGSIHPDGTAILMRTHSSLFYYPMRPEQTAAEALSGEPCKLPDADETLGEAVTWFADGAQFVTIGEGAGAQVNTSSCTPT
jgi:hypothetical protein